MYKKRSLKELYRLAKGERLDCCATDTPKKSCCSNTEEVASSCDGEGKKDCG